MDAIPLSEATNRPRVRVPRAVVGVILASIVVYAFLIGLAMGLAPGPWRQARSESSVLWHGLVPILGVVLLMIPISSLLKPDTPMPRALRPGTILADGNQGPA